MFIFINLNNKMSKDTDANDKKLENSTKQENLGKPADFYYEPNYKEKKIIDSDLPQELVPFKNVIGQDANRRYNYYFLNDQEIITAIANTFQIININTKERKIFHGTEN